jgi:hypothetical protein
MSAGAMRLKRLDLPSFEQLCGSTRLGPQARNMARAVLVDGRTLVDVAAEHGMSKQRVKLAVDSVEREYSRLSGELNGVVRIEVEIPAVVAIELSQLIDRLSSCQDESLKQASQAGLVAALRDFNRSLLP